MCSSKRKSWLSYVCSHFDQSLHWNFCMHNQMLCLPKCIVLFRVKTLSLALSKKSYRKWHLWLNGWVQMATSDISKDNCCPWGSQRAESDVDCCCIWLVVGRVVLLPAFTMIMVHVYPLGVSTVIQLPCLRMIVSTNPGWAGSEWLPKLSL